MFHDDLRFFSHTVKNGETLYHIAEQYKLPLVLLIRANLNILDPNSLAPGQLLRIPSEAIHSRFRKIKGILEACKILVRTDYANQENPDGGKCLCGELIHDVYKLNDINLPAASSKQSNQGIDIPLEKIELGDLLFFTTRTRSQKFSSHHEQFVGHSAIALNKNKFLHPSSYGKKDLMVSEFNDYYKRVFVIAKRVIIEDYNWMKDKHEKYTLALLERMSG